MASRQEIIEATYLCVARSGLSKTTVEDAAREAGVSRATVYRLFPGGREELLDATVAWATLDFFLRLYEEVRDAATLEEVMERGIAFAHRAILEHQVLQRVLQTEPEKLLPALTVESNRIRSGIAAFLVPFLEERGIAEGVDPGEASDFLARMLLSYMAQPGRWDLEDPAQVARLVRSELLAGVVSNPEAPSGGSPRTR
ncbi:MAG: TetR/AcrR family transcriptional regulator [Acidimicrobiales bacterium]